MRSGVGVSFSSARSSTIARLSTPTWFAARPMPGAAYIVSSMSSSRRRTVSSTTETGLATAFRRASGAMTMGRTAMT